MVFCSKCGKSIAEENYEYCPYCGNKSDLSHSKLKEEKVDYPPKPTVKNYNAQKIAIVVGVCIGVLVTIALLAYFFSGQNPGSPDVRILETNIDTEVGLLNSEYTVSGRIINTGDTMSNPILLKVTIATEGGEPLYDTQTAPNPSTLPPGQETSFSKTISTDDIGEYSGSRIQYWVEVVQE